VFPRPIGRFRYLLSGLLWRQFQYSDCSFLFAFANS
jgi:hypothetical protein